MKRILAFAIFAAALFSGCSSTLHPAITVQASGGMLLISGTGFSPTNPCATLSIVYNPGSIQAQTITSINQQTNCNISGSTASFTNYAWPFTAPTCPSGNTTTIPAIVLAVDIKTYDPAAQRVSVPCSQPAAAAMCPSPLLGSQLPAANWSVSSAAPGYYATQSAIMNSGNGTPIITQPSLSTIEGAMGGVTAFNGATFSMPIPGSGGGLPSGVMSCSYHSPPFQYRNQTAFAQVTVACTTSCSSL
jgi:hypothetical protein